MTREEAIEIIDRQGMVNGDKDTPLSILWDLLYGYATTEESQERFDKL